jgi:hypothetical protein
VVRLIIGPSPALLVGVGGSAQVSDDQVLLGSLTSFGREEGGDPAIDDQLVRDAAERKAGDPCLGATFAIHVVVLSQPRAAGIMSHVLADH